MTIRIAFRTDASLQIGIGHVMRCLTLADVLRARGVQCHFISRVHPGHLLEVVQRHGHIVNSLAAPVEQAQSASNSITKIARDAPNYKLNELAHVAWLGSTWQADAQETSKILGNLKPDCLVVDHYSLDQQWESALAAHCHQVMVIDDLADRPHLCSLLLDQNLGRQPQNYAGIVPTKCQVLTGPEYALLRPEFAALRSYSLQRRQAHPVLRQLLINMGGVDQTNATGQVLRVLKFCELPPECRITVVMGPTAPWLKNVQDLAEQMPWPTTVLVNVTEMAQHMANSDLAIGAAGSTSWERCCLGLPTLMVVLADNQRGIASALDRAGAAMTLDLTNIEQFSEQLVGAISHLVDSQYALCNLGISASKVTQGSGSQLVAAQLLGNLMP